MSAIRDTIRAIRASGDHEVADVLERHDDKIRGIEEEQRLGYSALAREVRTERQITRDGFAELAKGQDELVRGQEALAREIEKLAKALGTNGTGGHRG